MEKWIAKIERIKMDTDSNLDRKCIGLNNVTIIFCDTRKQYNLTGNQFEDNHYFAQKGSCFDPFYGGCYIVPGEITTLRAIHIRALKYRIREKLVADYFDYHFDANGIHSNQIVLYSKYLPALK